jgi:Zn-dependent protease
MHRFRYRIGPGTAICFGLLMALFSVWATGGDPRPGIHILAVFATRVLMTLFALSFHEWAHGAAAYVLGDTTARDRGRLTIDPRAHFDLYGLLIVPGLLTLLGSPFSIGWAKPVPVDFDKLRNKRWGTALVAVAGPAANVMMALACGSLLHILDVDGTESLLGSAAWTFAFANLGLGIFNLLPFYPMDGGRIVSCLLPQRPRDWLVRHERRAACITVAGLVVIPALLVLTGTDEVAMGPVSVAAEGASTFMTGQHDALWFGPMQTWLEQR